MLRGEVQSEQFFSVGLYHVPHGVSTIAAGAPSGGALSELRQALKQHALGESVNQWAPPGSTTTAAAGASADWTAAGTAAAAVATGQGGSPATSPSAANSGGNGNGAAAGGAAAMNYGPLVPFGVGEHTNALPVTVYLTNYRVVLSYLVASTPPRLQLGIPFATISDVEKGRSGSGVFWIDLVGKLPYVVRIAGDNEVRLNTLAREIVVRIPRRLKDLFAYVHGKPPPPPPLAAVPATTATTAGAGGGKPSPPPPPTPLVPAGVDDPVSTSTVEPATPSVEAPPPSTAAAAISAPSSRAGTPAATSAAGGASAAASLMSSCTAPPLPSAVSSYAVQMSGAPADPGWAIYSPEAELTRIAGRRSDLALAEFLAAEFATYPTVAFAPAAAVAPENAQLLLDVARYRQNARVPIVSWADPNGTAMLARASQPRVGAVQRRSKADELLCGMLIGVGLQNTNAAVTADPSSSSSVAAAPTTTDVQRQQQQQQAKAASLLLRSMEQANARPPSLFDNNNSFDSFPTDTGSINQRGGGAEAVNVANAVAAEATPAGSATPPPAMTKAAAGPLRVLHVADCRSRAAAAANQAAGGGHELSSHYVRTVSHFLSLANIHAVAKSYAQLRALCAAAQANIGSSSWSSNKEQHLAFWTKLAQTDWPTMTMKLLYSANRVADLLTTGDSVLVHCTDGWDRTSQITSLTMILLDPYYRSASGFCILVEQEWLRAGHRFNDRCGTDSSHTVGPSSADKTAARVTSLLQRLQPGGPDSDDDAADEIEGEASGITTGATDAKGIKPVPSPVFLQFLDAVFQLLHWFPTAFEFTAPFLRLLGESAYNGRFGTFLGNTHRSRHERQRHASATTVTAAKPSPSAAASTNSLWDYVALRVEKERQELRAGGAAACARGPADRLLNPFYSPAGETSAQRVARQLSAFGFPPSVLDMSGLQPSPSTDGFTPPSVPVDLGATVAPPPPVATAAAALPPKDGSRVPISGVGQRRLVPSSHCKRYVLWSSFFLGGDFDKPQDLTSGAAVVGSLGHESVEAPGADAHIALLAGAAEACRRAVAGSASNNKEAGDAARSASNDGLNNGGANAEHGVDSLGAVLRLFPCAITDPQEFIRVNCVGSNNSGGHTYDDPCFAMHADGEQPDPCGTAAPDDDDPTTLATPALHHHHHHHPKNPAFDDSAAAGGGVASDEEESRNAVYFIPREDAAVCYICEGSFSLWNRRHTCRMCSRSVCGRCGNIFVVLTRGQIALKDEKHLAGSKLRICTNCHVTFRTSSTTSIAATFAAGGGAAGTLAAPPMVAASPLVRPQPAASPQRQAGAGISAPPATED